MACGSESVHASEDVTTEDSNAKNIKKTT